MKHDARQSHPASPDALGRLAPHRALDQAADAELHRPLVVTHGEARVLFGPGLDDFNAYDDPC